MDLKGPQASNIVPVFRLTKAQPIVNKKPPEDETKKTTVIHEYVEEGKVRPSLNLLASNDSSAENVIVGFLASPINSSTHRPENNKHSS